MIIVLENKEDKSIALMYPATPKLGHESEAEFITRLLDAAPDLMQNYIHVATLPKEDIAVIGSTAIDYDLDLETLTVTEVPTFDQYRDCWRWKTGTKKLAVDTTLEKEERWKRARKIRNKLLEISDAGMIRVQEIGTQTEIDSMKDYRQSLRDVPQNNANPKSINWPSQP